MTAKQAEPEPKPNGGTEHPAATLWPNRAKAARMLGVSVATLKRMVDDGEIDEVYIGNHYRFDPDELADRKRAIAAGEALEETVNGRNTDRALVTELRSMVLDLHKLTIDPVRKLHEAASAENERLTKRVSELEDKHLAAIVQYEKSVSEQAVRDILERESAGKERRREQILDRGLKGIDVIAEKWGSQTEFSKLVATLTDEQLAVLEEMKFLTKQQAATLHKIRGGATAPVKPETTEGNPSNAK